MSRYVYTDQLETMSRDYTSRPTVSAKIYNMKTYFSSLFTDNPPAWAYDHSYSPKDYIRPQGADWDQDTQTLVSAINYNGTLYAMKHSSSTATSLLTGCNQYMKPAVYCNAGTAYIDAIDSAGRIRRFTLTISNMSSSWAYVGSWTFTNGGALYNWGSYISLMVLDEGGVKPYRFNYSGGTWYQKTTTKRFVVPDTILTDPECLLYSASIFAFDASLNTYYYFTNPSDGSVMGMEYRPTYDDWTDVFTAVESDLSQFWVTGAYRVNRDDFETVLMGVFSRTEEFDTDIQHILALESKNSRDFSIERHALAATGLTYPYIPVFGYNTSDEAFYLFGVDHNRAARDKLYKNDYVDVPADRIKDFSDQSAVNQNSANLSLLNSDEYYTGNSYIRKGNKVVVNFGYLDMWPTTLTYGTYLITGTSEDFADGKRSLTLQLAHYGLEKSARFTHPFYTEIIGHTGTHDNLEDTSNLYPAPKCGVAKSWLQVDFWDSTPPEKTITTGQADPWPDYITGNYNPIVSGGVQPIYIGGSHWNGSVGIVTADLKDKLGLLDYPKVMYGNNASTIADVVVKIYAWSSTVNTGDSNDCIYTCLVVEDAEGEKRKVYATTAMQTSTYINPPKTYNGTAAGSYPVIYTIPGSNFSAGDKIKQIIIAAAAGNVTNFCPERVRIENVYVVYDDGHSNTMWDTNEDAPNTLELNRPGRTYMMFSQKPYSPTHFNVWARFSCDTQEVGNTWGVCGFAEDAHNYIGAQYRVTGATTGIYEIVMRRGGKEFVLSSSGAVVINNMTIMLKHRNGIFSLHTYVGNAWSTLLSTTMVDDYGPLSTSQDGIQHVGVYGKLGIDPFMTTGYIHAAAAETTSDGDLIHDGIPVMPGWSEIDSFPSSGTVIIDDSEYTYSSKTYEAGPWAIGPYQCRRTQKYDVGTAVDITLFSYNNATTYQNKLLATDNGHVWLIDDDPYSIFNVIDDGSLVLRSRHFGTHMTGNYVGLDNRAYLTRGLGGVTLVQNSGRHYHGAFVNQKPQSKIVLKGFGATGGESYSSLAYLIESICKNGGVTAQFADYTATSVWHDANVLTWIRPTTDCSANGYEIHFKAPAISTAGNWIGIYTNALFKIRNSSGTQVSGRTIALWNNSGSTYLYALDTSYSPIEGVSLGAIEQKQIRIIFHGNFCTVYDGESWVHTFFFDSVTYPKFLGTAVALTGNYGAAISEVRLVELHYPREAVYVEMNANIQSALSNVIQERPIVVIPKPDGSLLFTYRSRLMPLHLPTKYSLYTSMIKSHNITNTSKNNACSDAILYYSDVTAVVDKYYAQEAGFITRILSFPNIADDEIYSIAKVVMRANRESEIIHTIIMRPDLRIEVGDVIEFDYTLSGTGTTYSSPDILVEGVSLSVASNQMQITGRKLII